MKNSATCIESLLLQRAAPNRVHRICCSVLCYAVCVCVSVQWWLSTIIFTDSFATCSCCRLSRATMLPPHILLLPIHRPFANKTNTTNSVSQAHTQHIHSCRAHANAGGQIPTNWCNLSASGWAPIVLLMLMLMLSGWLAGWLWYTKYERFTTSLHVFVFGLNHNSLKEKITTT